MDDTGFLKRVFELDGGDLLEISGKALVEYFAPLKTWFDEQNIGQPEGW